MRILVAGASGFIGTALRRELEADGHEVRALVRRPARDATEYEWQPAEGRIPIVAVEWADGVVNLSGAYLGRVPWTRAYRREIYFSRVTATRTIARAIAAADDPPRVWVSGSATGYYGHRPGELLTEDSPAGEGFLAGVVSRWEAATARADDVTRVVHIRTGVVLADGGSLSPLLLATRLGAGATIGTGQQLWPWISLEDEVAAIVHLLTRSELSGPVNLTGPEPAPSAEITRLYARAMRRPHLLRVPDWLLRLVVGEPADEILLPDQRVVPTRLLAEGFEFRHPTAQEAVAAAVLR